MELTELIGFFEIESGSPSPIILSNDTQLTIFFYINTELPIDIDNFEVGAVSIKFNSFLIYKFGIPGSETLHGHPYYSLGMRSLAFYELKDSDLIKQLKAIDEVHPNFDSEKWLHYRHYILTFHDNLFECVSKNFTVKKIDVLKLENLNSLVENCLNE